MNPLNSVRGAITTGVVIALILMILIAPTGFQELGLARWLHILSGVMWIGLLWYFNVVQIPALGVAAADKGGPGGAGITKYVAPRALFWFRWSALATVVTGVLLAWMLGFLVQALTLAPSHRAIGIGVYLALVMAFNVWFIIWPNQKKALGIVTVDAAEKAAAAKKAGMTSRVNTMLSIPMLYCMVGQSHTGF